MSNKMKRLMYTLNSTNSNYKSQNQQILNQINQFKIDNCINANANTNKETNTNIEIKMHKSRKIIKKVRKQSQNRKSKNL